MKLVDLTEYLINPEQLKILYQEKELNTESEVLLIYMRDVLDLESDIVLFGIEETKDDIIYEKDGVHYIQLFPINYAIELIEYDLELKGKGYTKPEIATRLLEYRIKDA